MTSVLSRYSLSYPAILARLNKFAPILKESNRQLLMSQSSLDCGFDNFQVFLSTKYQRDSESADSLYATCRLAKRPVIVVPTIGSLLVNGLDNNADYFVVSIVRHTAYVIHFTN